MPDKNLRHLIALVLIWSGLVLMEAVSNHVIPLSLQSFTSNAFLIGLILAVNPLFGVLVQPVIGIMGDRIWTPFGRRTFFIKIAAPVLAVCLVFFPEATDFLLLIVLVVVFHFFLDVVYGADHPLLADLIPNNKRSVAMGWMLCVGQVSQFLFLRYLMGYLTDAGGIEITYRVSAVLALTLMFGASFLIKEKPPVVSDAPKMTFRRYFQDFLNEPMMVRFGLLSFFRSAGINGMLGYIVLFSINNYGLTDGEYARTWSLTSLLYFTLAVPVGIVVEKLMPKNYALGIGYGLILGSAALAFYADDPAFLTAIAILFGMGSVIESVTIKPFYCEFMPPEKLGQLSGALNICYGTGRLFALIVCGWVVRLFDNNYQAAWPVVIFCMIVASALSIFIPDKRFHLERLRD
ncbi:MAG: MFS transporter [Opitutales bacterium]|nr:MFS transporter [Opitutales bacterium]